MAEEKSTTAKNELFAGGAGEDSSGGRSKRRPYEDGRSRFNWS